MPHWNRHSVVIACSFLHCAVTSFRNFNLCVLPTIGPTIYRYDRIRYPKYFLNHFQSWIFLSTCQKISWEGRLQIYPFWVEGDFKLSLSQSVKVYWTFSLVHCLHIRQISWKYAHNFLTYPADEQTDKRWPSTRTRVIVINAKMRPLYILFYLAILFLVWFCCRMWYLRVQYKNFRGMNLKEHRTGHVTTDAVKWLGIAIAATILTVISLFTSLST